MLAALLVGAAIPATAAGDAPVFADPGAQATPTGGRTVTLLTGDVVTYSGSGNSLQIERIVPGEGREGMGFTRHHVDGHEYAVPIDAAEQIERGHVDQRLFDVTELVASGYGDGDTSALRLVVGDAPSVAGGPRAPEHARVADRFDTARAAVLSVPKKNAGAVWEQLATTSSAARSAGIGKVWLDGRVKASLDESVPQIGADEAHRRGATGKGVKVAVLDTGYDAGTPTWPGGRRTGLHPRRGRPGQRGPRHPRLGDHRRHRRRAQRPYAGRRTRRRPRRGQGPRQQRPRLRLLDHRRHAVGRRPGRRHRHHAPRRRPASDGTDPCPPPSTALREHGTLFVIAAGNTGAARSARPAPRRRRAHRRSRSTNPDTVAPSPSRGPRDGRCAVKPEIAAPGSSIIAPAPPAR